MNKDFIDENDEQFEIEVENAIFSCFEYDEDLLVELFKWEIPTTVFEDKLKREHIDILIKNDELNYSKVNVWKYG